MATAKHSYFVRLRGFLFLFLPSFISECGFGGALKRLLRTRLNSGFFVGSAMFTSEPIESPLFSARLRLARAHEHLDDLDSQMDKFFAEKPYTPMVDLDPDGVHVTHKIQVTKRFPTNWCLLVTEIIEHLRASLDHAVFATRTKADTDLATFPFAKSPADLDNRVRGVAKDTPPEIQSLLRSFNCYRGGNDLLHSLNDVCNASKHALIMLVTGATIAGEIRGFGETWASGVQFFDPLNWNSAKNEIPYARTKRGFDFQHQGKISVYVALQNSEGMSTEPVGAVLEAMLAECLRVVTAIEAVGVQIGAFS